MCVCIRTHETLASKSHEERVQMSKNNRGIDGVRFESFKRDALL